MIKKLVLVLLILFPMVGRAQNNTTRFFVAYDHEELTVAGTAVGFTSSKVTSTSNTINSAELVTFSVTCASGTTCPVRFLVDTGTPTSSIGQLVDTGSFVAVYGHVNIVNFRAIRTTSTSATLDAVYYR